MNLDCTYILQFCDISLYRYRFQRTCTANKKHTWANLVFNIHHLWCHNFCLVCCSAKNDLKEKRFYCGIVVAMVHLSFKIFTLSRLSTNIYILYTYIYRYIYYIYNIYIYLHPFLFFTSSNYLSSILLSSHLWFI